MCFTSLCYCSIAGKIKEDCQGGQVGLENKHKCWFTVSIICVVAYSALRLFVFRRCMTELESGHTATHLHTAAAGSVSHSGDLSRTLSELLHMRRVLLLLCTHYCSY